MSTTQAHPESTIVRDVSPEQLREWLEADKVLLVDVREGPEHASEHIAGAVLFPLSGFDPQQVRARGEGKTVVFHCRSGKRSLDAAKRFARDGEPVHHLAGGIEAWKRAGLPVLRSQGAPRIPIMRQVQIAAGALVVVGVALGAAVSPWFLILSGFVGCGLMFAGISGWCGMALLLGRMPWNRSDGHPSGASCCTA